MAADLAWTAEVMQMAGQQPGVAASGGPAPGLQRADGTPIRVLVVDDEPSLAELLASVLRYEGWEIQTAGDGSSAVRTAREFRPDAVVLDIMLPDFDGLEVLRRVRAELPHVCVLFLTARDAVEDRVAGITAGGDDYVTKPFSLEEVLARAQILDRVWNYDFGGQAHVVELYISYLRKKIDSGREPLIHTVRGVGYVLKPAS